MRNILIVMVATILMVGCGSKKKIVTKKRNASHRNERVVEKPKTETPSEVVVSTGNRGNYANATEAYIANYKSIAQEEMRKYKIPASITLAQGILESASGQGRLAVEANNHFGIKCHNWTGGKIYHDDDERQECFRKYKHANESFEDHSTFLSTRSRYAKLFKLDIDDYKGWARELRAAGYATDKKYPEKLIGLIERFELYKYDEEVLGRKRSSQKPEVQVDAPVTHQVVKGDTLYSISKKYGTTVEAIQRLNNLTDVNISLGQVLRVQ